MTTEPIEDFNHFPPVPFVNDGRGVVLGPGPDTDSVDGDDGVIDGWGNDGHSFRSTATGRLLDDSFINTLQFSFQASADGKYPTAFGFAWTDGEPDPLAMVLLGVVEIDSVGATTTTLLEFPTVDGDSEFNGGTSEDQFIGFISDKGILTVGVTSSFGPISDTDDGSNRQLFFEMDHLQFGYRIVPEPATMTLLAGFLVLSRAATRRHGYLETKSVPE